jgi:hypothetical protein
MGCRQSGALQGISAGVDEGEAKSWQLDTYRQREFGRALILGYAVFGFSCLHTLGNVGRDLLVSLCRKHEKSDTRHTVMPNLDWTLISPVVGTGWMIISLSVD